MELESLSIRIARTPGLAMLPTITQQVLKVADDPNTSPKQLSVLIERDTGLAAKVLRMANSSFYTAGGRVQTMSQAVAMLGINAVRSIVVGQAYQQIISARSQSNRFDRNLFWSHSFATAVAGRILARLKGLRDAEELFMGGLLHDLGRLVLDRFVSSEFDRAILYSIEQACPLWMAEQEILGYTHVEAGHLLAEHWHLPASLQAVIAKHQQPVAFDENPSQCLVYVANIIAHQAGFGLGSPVIYEIDTAVQESLNIPVEQYESIQQAVVEEVIKTQQLLKIAS